MMRHVVSRVIRHIQAKSLAFLIQTGISSGFFPHSRGSRITKFKKGNEYFRLKNFLCLFNRAVCSTTGLTVVRTGVVISDPLCLCELLEFYTMKLEATIANHPNPDPMSRKVSSQFVGNLLNRFRPWQLDFKEVTVLVHGHQATVLTGIKHIQNDDLPKPIRPWLCFHQLSCLSLMKLSPCRTAGYDLFSFCHPWPIVRF